MTFRPGHGSASPGGAPSPGGASAARVRAVQTSQVQAGWRDVLAEASEHLERIEGNGVLAGERMDVAAAVGAGGQPARDLQALEGDRWVDEIAALCGPASYADHALAWSDGALRIR